MRAVLRLLYVFNLGLQVVKPKDACCVSYEMVG